MQLQDNVRAFLNERRFAVLATINADGTSQQTVIWYDLHGDEILMNTRAGRVKDANLRRDARASLCVPDGYRYVTLEGPSRSTMTRAPPRRTSADLPFAMTAKRAAIDRRKRNFRGSSASLST